MSLSAVKLAVEHGFVTDKSEDTVVVGQAAGQSLPVAAQLPLVIGGVNFLAPVVRLGGILIHDPALDRAQCVVKRLAGKASLGKIVQKRRLLVAGLALGELFPAWPVRGE